MRSLEELLQLSLKEEQKGNFGEAKLLLDQALEAYGEEMSPSQSARIAHNSAALLGQLLDSLPVDEEEEDDGLLTIII